MARSSPLNLLGRRPLVLFVGALAAGLVARLELGLPALGLGAAPLLVLGAARVRSLAPWMLSAGFLAGVLRTTSPPEPPPAPSQEGLPRLVRLEGRVASPPFSGERGDLSFLVATQTGVVRLVWSMPRCPLGRGDRVRATGLARPRPGTDARGSSWSCHTQGSHLEVLERGGLAHPLGWIDRARQTLRSCLEEGLEEPARGLAFCLLLGESERLDPWDILRFRHTGTAHLLVVSGLHVTLLAALVLRLLPGKGAPLAWILVLAYALLAGARPPALRAAVGFGLWVAAPLFGRARDLASTLAAAALPLLLLTPEEVHGASFQISYAAVAALGYLGPPLQRGLRSLGVPPGLARVTGYSSAATLGTAPILLAHFGSFSPFGLLLTPLLTPVLGVAVGSAGLAVLLPGVGGPVLAATYRGMLELLTLVDALPTTPVYAWVWPATGPVLVGLVLALALLLAPRSGLRPLGPLALCLPFFLPGSGSDPAELPRARLLDVGHGQCLLLDLPGHGLVVHDAGSLWHTRGLVGALDQTMRSWGRRRVDLLVVSHGDRDHTNALPMLLGGYPLRRAVLPAQPTAEETASRLAARGIPVTRIPPGGQLLRSLGSCRLLLLRPGDGRGSSNQESLVLHAKAPGLSLLSPGDLEGPTLRALIRQGKELAAATLVAPHHGRSMGLESEIVRAFGVYEVLISRAASAGDPPARPAYLAAGARVRWTAAQGDLDATPGPEDSRR